MAEKVKTARDETTREETSSVLRPRIGDRVELRLPRLGVCSRGTVHNVDGLQILVKWDDGRSQSLRSTYADRIRILPTDDD